MNKLEYDDELLLLELERRDGIYSFIFHELEDHQTETKEINFKDEQTLFESSLKENNDSNNVNLSKVERKLDVVMPSASTPPPANIKSQTTACLFANESSKPLTHAGHNTKALNPNEMWKSWQSSAAVNSQLLPFNFQFQMPGPNYCTFKNPSIVKPWGIRKAKPTFSHVYEPLVRNRRHKLKETPEYKSFGEHPTKVADLRQLFPLDPDAYAPFTKINLEGVKTTKSCGVIVENVNYLE